MKAAGQAFLAWSVPRTGDGSSSRSGSSVRGAERRKQCRRSAEASSGVGGGALDHGETSPPCWPSSDDSVGPGGNSEDEDEDAGGGEGGRQARDEDEETAAEAAASSAATAASRRVSERGEVAAEFAAQLARYRATESAAQRAREIQGLRRLLPLLDAQGPPLAARQARRRLAELSGEPNDDSGARNGEAKRVSLASGHSRGSAGLPTAAAALAAGTSGSLVGWVVGRRASSGRGRGFSSTPSLGNDSSALVELVSDEDDGADGDDDDDDAEPTRVGRGSEIAAPALPRGGAEGWSDGATAASRKRPRAGSPCATADSEGFCCVEGDVDDHPLVASVEHGAGLPRTEPVSCPSAEPAPAAAWRQLFGAPRSRQGSRGGGRASGRGGLRRGPDRLRSTKAPRLSAEQADLAARAAAVGLPLPTFEAMVARAKG